uniref:Single stranded DNA binding protein 3b n=1 Tax=Mastacembelus armatus TaxID=205130 RepID=A0A7N8Y106_9TELE
MFPKGKGTPVPSDGQAREKLALYVYEYLLHIGAQKSAQTFLSEIRWEKNITLGEPPGFLHSWWCVFWDLYCAAPERRETCDHSSEAKAFHDYSAAAAPSPVMGGMPPGEGMPGGPMPPGFFQPCFYDLWLPSQNFGGGMRPPHNTMGTGMPGVNMGPGTGRPWPNPSNTNSVSNNTHTHSHTERNAVLAILFLLQFPMGPGSDGPLGAMAGMEPHHMNGSLGSGDMDGMNKNSPNNLSGISNPPGTPRDDGELSGNFLHSFQSENYSPTMTMSV